MAYLNDRMAVLNRAYKTFYLRSRNMMHQRVYQELYEDIVAHDEAWFGLFRQDQNYVHAERCVGILGTLATVYRQQGNLEMTEKVLRVDGRVLEAYMRLAERAPDNRPFQECMVSLRYKYHVILFNLYNQTRREHLCPPIFRALCEYEIDKGLGFEEQQVLWECTVFTGGRPVTTRRQLARLKDDQIVRGLRKMNATEMAQPPEAHKPPETQLRVCHHCGTREAMLGDHKQCAACRTVVYCNRECQRGDWKAHKAACKAAKEQKAPRSSRSARSKP